MANLFGDIFSSFYEDDKLEKHLAGAQSSLQDFMEEDSLAGKTFLDAGCGGGLFSLAAAGLDAAAITSFDYDSKILEYCERLRAREGGSVPWKIVQGSVLDKKFVGGLGQFDYVYCWGVVHHTGNMWQAMENVLSCVKPEGFIYLGIYNKATAFKIWDDRRFGSSWFWWWVKRILHSCPGFIKKFVLFFATSVYGFMSKTESVFGKYEFKNFKERGMTVSVAIEDWLFGFPYEYASTAEVQSFLKSHGFELKRIQSNQGLRTNRYLFQKKI